MKTLLTLLLTISSSISTNDDVVSMLLGNAEAAWGYSVPVKVKWDWLYLNGIHSGAISPTKTSCKGNAAAIANIDTNTIYINKECPMTFANKQYFQNTLTHEVGHLLNVDHSIFDWSVMYPYLSAEERVITTWDRRGLDKR